MILSPKPVKVIMSTILATIIEHVHLNVQILCRINIYFLYNMCLNVSFWGKLTESSTLFLTNAHAKRVFFVHLLLVHP